jgi:putative ABC transport system permease protein
MTGLARLRSFLFALLRRRRLERDMEQEWQGHLDARVDALVASGVSRAEAERRARIEFGDPVRWKEQGREARGLGWIQDLSGDVQYGVRQMRRAPAFTAVVIATLALGIGANTAIFSVVYGVLLRPLPYKDPDTLVFIQTRDRLTGRVNPSGFSGPDLRDWTERTSAFDSLALCSRDIFALETENGFETVSGASVSEHFFSILGVPMAIGRPLSDAKAPESVISDRVWRHSFGRDPHVVGRRVRLNAQLYTIVGVARADFELPADNRRSIGAPPEAPGLWAPMGPAPTVEDRRFRYYQFIARLRTGMTLAQARSDTETAGHSIAADYPRAGQGFDPVVTRVPDELTGAVRPALLLLMGAVCLVLLVACANVANLLLTRQSSRTREIAIRVSLGASRLRLMRQLLVEASLLALLGGLAGVLLATSMVKGLIWLEPAEVPRLAAIWIDVPVLVFALGVSTLAALLAGAAPVVQLMTRDVGITLRPSGQTHTVRRGARRLRSALVIAELAMSLMLLVGAVLLARSFVNLLRTEIGATPDQVVTVDLNLAMGRTLSAARQIQLTDQLIERIRAVPGIQAVGAANGLPPNRTRMSFEFEMADVRDGTPGPRRLNLLNPTADYFSALGIPLLRGRLFQGADGPTAQRVVIVSVGAARDLFGTLDVVGRSLPIGPKRAPVPIVGVVGDVKYRGLDVAAPQTLYMPFAQYPFRNMTLVVRTSGDPRLVATNLEHAIHAVDREITRGPARTLDDVVSDAVAQPRFRTAVLSAIASLALILAGVGVYGVVAYAVAQRTVEIGVRMALGATASQVMGIVLRESLTLAVAGAALGSGGAYLGTRTLTAFLYGVTPTDAPSFGVAAASLVGLTMLASWVPARRATHVDPVLALRYE